MNNDTPIANLLEKCFNDLNCKIATLQQKTYEANRAVAKYQTKLHNAIAERDKLKASELVLLQEQNELRADKERLDWLLNWNADGHPFKTREAIDVSRFNTH